MQLRSQDGVVSKQREAAGELSSLTVRWVKDAAVRLMTVRRKTVRRNFPKRVDGTAESHDTDNTDNMDSEVELDTVSVIYEGK